MKYLITLVLLLWISSAQAQRTFTFEIDGDKYALEETKLNDLFGAAFNAILQRGVAKEKDFGLWAKTFDYWKEPVAKGYWTITTYGDRVSSSTFTGEIPLIYLGWQEPSKPAKGNPNKESNIARRMGVMFTYLSREIIYHFTQKTIVN